MALEEHVYITGHQHPDTDATAAAIAYSFFKRTQGIPAVPCRLGDLNSETKYLLERFHFDEPMLLTDARKSLNEIKIDGPLCTGPETSVFDTLKLMQDTDQPYIGIVDKEKHLLGMVSKSDLVNVGLGDTALGIDLLHQTSVKGIAETISGKVIYDDKKVHINGKVSIIAITQSKLANYDITDRIVICGDDPDAQKELIQKGAGLLVIVWAKDIDKEVIALARKKHCPIIISGHGSMNTSRYLYFAPPVKLVMNTKLITFNEKELAEDVKKKIQQYRFRAFPVVDDENHLVGYVSHTHLMNYKNKKIILVDHNEFSQSVRAIEKAQLLEVLDHHRINDFATNQPVTFRNEIVGSTATIISKIFRENQIPLPANLAGLLLGAVLSDTLMFQSPTTTPVDRTEANILAALADLDIYEFGREMFNASANVKNKSIQELINTDIKFFDIHSYKTMISQVIVPELAAFDGREDEIQAELDKFTGKKELDCCVLALTGIMDNGSKFYVSGDKGKWAAEAFPNKPKEKRSLQEGVVSRKKQILPMVTEAIGKYA
ncbi:MAG: putative manganese-dependent inorganic diphosphatase [Erysipelotrichaceae bacterium]|nr:putative manganese-dependent inorganic diphosphatase [Erysipelotrichaceae bacterium]